jgi:hypothetical protein
MLRIIPAAESNEWFGSNLFQWDRFQTSERVRNHKQAVVFECCSSSQAVAREPRQRPGHLTVRSGRVLGKAVAEGPVFFLHLDKADKNVLTPEANALVQSVGDFLIESFLDFDGPPLIEGELDDQRILASLDS